MPKKKRPVGRKPSRHLRSKADLALRDALVAARASAGLTQRALAKKLGRPASYIAKIEIGERVVTALDLAEIAAVLGCEPGALLKG